MPKGTVHIDGCPLTFEIYGFELKDGRINFFCRSDAAQCPELEVMTRAFVIYGEDGTVVFSGEVPELGWASLLPLPGNVYIILPLKVEWTGKPYEGD